MTALAALQSWVSQLFVKPPIPLEYMRAGPGENTDNPLMVSILLMDSRTVPADDLARSYNSSLGTACMVH